MRKILFSTLLIFLFSHVIAQNQFADERHAAVGDHEYSNASLQSGSVLKMNIFCAFAWVFAICLGKIYWPL